MSAAAAVLSHLNAHWWFGYRVLALREGVSSWGFFSNVKAFVFVKKQKHSGKQS